MKFTCAQDTLNTHLSLVARAVPSRPSHPVLANILFHVDADTQQVSLTGFDLSMGVKTTFGAQVDRSGTLTLPAKLLTDIISKLPDGDLTLESIEQDGEVVTIASSSGRYTVRSMPSDEYPELPSIESTEDNDNTIKLSAEVLQTGLAATLFSVSTDETKQTLTGVHLVITQELIEMAGVDGHRLSVATFPDAIDANTTEFTATIPAKALREINAFLKANSEESIAVTFDESQMIFQWENQQLTTRLLEGQYPNYQQLIPRQFARCVTIDRRLFIGALERVAVLADQKNGIVKLGVSDSDQQVVISVDAKDVGSGRETVSAQITGEAIDIAFNVRYLLEGLKVMDSTEVQLQMNTSISPAIVSPLGTMKMVYLIMPVAIRN